MGVSKATLPFGAETMLQRVVRLLGNVVSPVIVVAAREQPLPSCRMRSASLATSGRRGPLEGSAPA